MSAAQNITGPTEKSIPPVAIDGVYGPDTKAAVLAAQRRFDLPETGSVGVQTWEEIYNQYSGIENATLRNGESFPGESTQNGRINYAQTTTATQFPGRDLGVGTQDPVRKEVVR